MQLSYRLKLLVRPPFLVINSLYHLPMIVQKIFSGVAPVAVAADSVFPSVTSIGEVVGATIAGALGDGAEACNLYYL